MKNIKWIFFDIGSTLVDESECYEMRYRETTENTAVPYQAFRDKVMEFAAVSDNPYQVAIGHFGLPKTRWHSELEKPYPDTEVVLQELSKKYTLGIIANQSVGCKDRLERWGIAQYFDLVIASAEEGVEKPNPDIFRRALERADCLPNKALMVGDRMDNDIVPAKQIGMKTVWVKQAFASYQPVSNIPNATIDSLIGVLHIV